MTRPLLMGVLLCLFVIVATDRFNIGSYVGPVSAKAAIISAERPTRSLNCEHAPQRNWRTVRTFDYEPMKTLYIVNWEICTGSPTEERVRITDADFKKVFFQFEDDEVVRVEKLDLLDNLSPQLFVLTMSAGTGDDIGWHIISESHGLLEEWKPPDYDGAAEKLLHSDEDFCCKDWNIHLQGNQVVLARGIYQKGEGNCCPSRGGVLVRLQPVDNGFKLVSVVRIGRPEYYRWRDTYFCLSCKLH